MVTPRPHTSHAGLALIRNAESFSSVVYFCPAGKPTIGYGHVVRPGDNFIRGISRKQGEMLLVEAQRVAIERRGFADQAAHEVATATAQQHGDSIVAHDREWLR